MSRKQLVFSSEIQKVCTTADYWASFPLAVIRGRGWAGSSIFKLLSNILRSFSGWVWRGMITVRPSVVGKCTSTIDTAANFSSTVNAP